MLARGDFHPAAERGAIGSRWAPRARRRRLAGGLLAWALAAAGCAPAAGAAERPPNILMVSIDTLRASSLSSYGYRRATSPNIDRLLARGARFTHAHTVEPLTAPALASMLTSLEPHQHGLTRNGLRVREDLFSFTKGLGRRGYRTAAFVGNWTLRDELSGLAEHFDTYVALLTRPRWLGLMRRESSADDLIEEGLEWLDEHLEREPSRPFLLWIHMVEPHAPYRLRRDFLGQLGLKASGSFFSATKRYDSEIAYADDRTGRLVEEVAARVAPEETLVLFFSDHGESLGDHGYWGHGRNLYEVSLRIPMGVVWPGRIEPRVIDEPALISDLAGTVLGLAGLPVPEFVDGHDWTPVLLDGAAGPAGRVTYHQAHRASVQPREDQVRVRTRGLLQVARMADGVKEVYHVTEDGHYRYDLAEDPHETAGLTAGGSALSAELGEWLESVREGLRLADDLPPPNLTDEDLDALRALGYID